MGKLIRGCEGRGYDYKRDYMYWFTVLEVKGRSGYVVQQRMDTTTRDATDGETMVTNKQEIQA